jgi:PAS domain S-box-containing protein
MDIFQFLRNRSYARYLVAVVIVAASFQLRYSMVQGLGSDLPLYITFYPAVFLVSILAGLGPCLMVTALIVLGTDLLILPPVGHFAIARPADIVAEVFFSVMGVCIGILAEAFRRSQRTITVYKAEQALRMSEQKLETALASMTDAVFLSDAKGEFLQFNDAFATFHRFSNKADCAQTLAEYSNFLEVYTPDGQLAPLEMWAVPRALRGEKSTNVEYKLKRKDTGETWYGSYSFAPLRDSFGAITGSVVVGRDITEWKLATELLRKSEILYRGLFSSMEEGFCIIEMIFDPTGKPVDYRFLETNTSFERQSGLQEAVGRRMRELVPSIEEHWFEIYGKVALTGESVHFFNESRALKRHFEASAYRVGEPELRQVAVVFSDVTERKRAEDHIQQLSRIYAVLSDINQAIVRSKDSPAMLKVACQIAVDKGKFPMAWIGMFDPEMQAIKPVAFCGSDESFLQYLTVDPLDPSQSDRPSVRCFNSGDHVVCNDIGNQPPSCLWRDYSLRQGYRSVASFPLKMDGRTVGVFNLSAGEPDFFVGDEMAVLDEMAMDISFALDVNRREEQRRKAEEELRWRTAFFEALVESNLDSILVVDSQWKKVLQNQKMINTMKIPPNVAENRDFANQLSFVAPFIKNPSNFMERIQYLMSHPEEVGRDEIELIDGTILDRYSSPVKDKADHYYGRIWSFRDITEARQLEEKFRQAQKMESIGQLTGGIAHDFNNLLTVILGCSEVISGEIKADQRLGKMAEMITSAAQRGAELTHRMLAFARRQALEPKPVDVNRLITDMESFLHRTLSADINLEVIHGCAECEAVVDPTQLESALLNLCVNARDAMPGGGTLTIETENVDLDTDFAARNPEIMPGSYVLVAVSDTGVGIAPEILGRVFDPFFTTKGVGKGTGLGLSMVYGFLKQSQGHVKIYSELGRGTSVKLFLPRTDAVGVTQASSPISSISGLRGSEVILIAEDNIPVRDFAKAQLEYLGYKVFEASNGNDALEIVRQHDEIDLLLTDIVMPGGMNGFELSLEAGKLNPKLKVLFSSGYAENAILHQGMLNKDVRLLNKPYSRLELANRVRSLLDAE